MHLNTVGPDACLEFKALVYELLGLDPASLAKMDTETSSVAVGLNLFVRQTLQRAIRHIWAADDTVFRLCDDATSKAIGWDTATRDLSTLFAFALVAVARKARGSSHIPLCPASAESVVEGPQNDGELWTAAKCAAVTVALLKESILQVRDAPGPGASQSLSVCELIKQRLGLKPKDLVRPLYQSQREANRAFARDPEGQVIIGLAQFLMRLIEVSQAAAAQNIDAIRLLIWDASCGRAGPVRMTNISSVLTAGFLAEAGRDIAFLVQSTAPAHSSALH